MTQKIRKLLSVFIVSVYMIYMIFYGIVFSLESVLINTIENSVSEYSIDEIDEVDTYLLSGLLLEESGDNPIQLEETEFATEIIEELVENEILDNTDVEELSIITGDSTEEKEGIINYELVGEDLDVNDVTEKDREYLQNICQVIDQSVEEINEGEKVVINASGTDTINIGDIDRSEGVDTIDIGDIVDIVDIDRTDGIDTVDIGDIVDIDRTDGIDTVDIGDIDRAEGVDTIDIGDIDGIEEDAPISNITDEEDIFDIGTGETEIIKVQDESYFTGENNEEDLGVLVVMPFEYISGSLEEGKEQLRDMSFKLSFNNEIEETTLSGNIVLEGEEGIIPININIIGSGNILLIENKKILEPDSEYILKIIEGLVDVYGNELGKNKEINFKTLGYTKKSKSTGGNWSNPNTWEGGVIPNSQDVVYIDGLVRLDTNPTVNGLIVSERGVLESYEIFIEMKSYEYSGNHTRKIVVKGDLKNNGTIRRKGFWRGWHKRTRCEGKKQRCYNFKFYELEIDVIGNIENNGGWGPSKTWLSGENKIIKGENRIGGEILLKNNIKVEGSIDLGGTLNLNGKILNVDGKNNKIDIGTITGNGKVDGNGEGEILIRGNKGGDIELDIFESTIRGNVSGTLSGKNLILEGGEIGATINGDNIILSGGTQNINGNWTARESGKVEYTRGTKRINGGYTINGNLEIGTGAILESYEIEIRSKNGYHPRKITIKGEIENNGTIRKNNKKFKKKNRKFGYPTTYTYGFYDLEVIVEGDIENNSYWGPSKTYLVGESKKIDGKSRVGGEILLSNDMRIEGGVNIGGTMNLNGKTLSVDGKNNLIQFRNIGGNGKIDGNGEGGILIRGNKGGNIELNVSESTIRGNISGILSGKNIIMEGGDIGATINGDNIILSGGTQNVNGNWAVRDGGKVEYTRGTKRINGGYTISGNLEIGTGAILESYEIEITNRYSRYNGYHPRKITIKGEIENNGTIRKKSRKYKGKKSKIGYTTTYTYGFYDLEVIVGGNIKNTGTWSPSKTFISRVSKQGSLGYLYQYSQEGGSIEGMEKTSTTSYQIPNGWMGQTKYWNLYTINDDQITSFHKSGCINANCESNSEHIVYYTNPITNETIQLDSNKNDLLQITDEIRKNNEQKQSQSGDVCLIKAEACGDPVELSKGEVYKNETYMYIPGVGIPFKLDMVYRSRKYYEGPVGVNWDYSYNIYIKEQENGKIRLFNGNLGVSEYELGGYNPGVKAKLIKEGNQYRLKFDSGKTYYFNEKNKRIEKIEDKEGNSITFHYSDIDINKLAYIRDTLGRLIDFDFDTKGRLIVVEDFNKRKVKYEYYSQGEEGGMENDLKKIILEDETGETKETVFTYTMGDNINGHNLKSVKDNKGQTFVEYTYHNNDLVETQRLGEGTIYYEYEEDNGKITKTKVTNRAGVKSEYNYDNNGNLTRLKIIKKDGTYTINDYIYDETGYLIQEIKPNGSSIEYTYDEKGNTLSKRYKEDRIAENSEDDIVTYYQYTGYDVLSKIINPNGNIMEFEMDENGNITKKIKRGVTTSQGIKEDIIEAYEYDQNGQLISTTNANGLTTYFEYINGLLQKSKVGTGTEYIESSFEYDEYGNMIKTIDGKGNEKIMEYNGFNQLKNMYTAENIKMSYTYDENGNLKQEDLFLKNGEQVTSVMDYNIENKPTTIKGELQENKQIEVTNIYDENGRLIRTQTTDGAIVMYEYTETSRVNKKIVLDPDTNTQYTTSYEYDNVGNLIRQTDAKGNYMTYQYDGFGRVKKITDAVGSYITNKYDKNGNLLESKTYSAEGELLRKSKADYDELNRVVRNYSYPDLEDESKTLIVRYYYDKLGNLVKTVAPKGNINLYKYDQYNRLVKEVEDNGDGIIGEGDISIEYTYDKNSNIIQQKIDGVVRSYEYDKDNRVVSETVNGKIKEKIKKKYEYDNMGNISSYEDGEGNITNYEYDYAGNLLKETKYLKEGETKHEIITKYEYDLRGNLTKIIDPEGNETIYEYDKLNRNVKVIYDDGNSIIYNYDEIGNLLTQIDPNGTKVTNSYDKLNRLVGRKIEKGEGVGGIESETYNYDRLGRLIGGEDSNLNSLGFNYDDIGRLLVENQKVSGIDKQVSYQYDQNSNLTNIIYPNSNIVNYSYDIYDRLTEINLNDTLINKYKYDGINLQEEQRGNGTKVIYSYDEFNRLSNLTNKDKLSEIITKYDYLYDKVGNIISDGQKEYKYDSIYRLTEIDYGGLINGLEKQIYEYDNVGNREIFLTEIRVGTGVEIIQDYYQTNELNQYLTITGDNQQQLKYDKNGNIINNGDFNFKYDYKNRLIEVTGKNGKIVVEYEYDILGRRVIKKDGKKIKRYVYSNDDIIEEIEYKEQGKEEGTRTYVNGIGIDDVIAFKVEGNKEKYIEKTGEQIFCEERVLGYKEEFETYGWIGVVERCESVVNNSIYYYHKNHLGSVIGISDGNGELLIEYDYDAYGKAYVKDGDSWVLFDEYEGEDYGNSRLFTAREYDREIGLYYYRARYYDPVLGRFISRDPIGQLDDINLYGYVGNSPLMGVDPSGNIAFVPFIVGAAVGGVTNVAVSAIANYGNYSVSDALVDFGVGAVSGGGIGIISKSSLILRHKIYAGSLVLLGDTGVFTIGDYIKEQLDGDNEEFDRNESIATNFIGSSMGAGAGGCAVIVTNRIFGQGVKSGINSVVDVSEFGSYGWVKNQLDNGVSRNDIIDVILKDDEVVKTLDRVNRKAPSVKGDFKTFYNRESFLTDKRNGYYREWQVDTPGLNRRGYRRIVSGESGEIYFTDDHYKNFIKIK